MKILAQRFSPYCNRNDLPKAPSMDINAIVSEPLEVLDEYLEPVDVETRENEVN